MLFVSQVGTAVAMPGIQGGGISTKSQGALIKPVEGVHYIPRVNDDLVIDGALGHPLTVVVHKAFSTVELLKGCKGKSVKTLNIIARNVTGDVMLQNAPHVVEKMRIWIENLNGNIHLPTTGLSHQHHDKPTSDWLRLHVGPIKDLAGQIPVQTEYNQVMNRLAALEEKVEHHEEAQKAVKGHTEDFKVVVPAAVGKAIVGDDPNSYYIKVAEEGIHVMSNWSEKDSVPEVNVFLGSVEKGIIVNMGGSQLGGKI